MAIYEYDGVCPELDDSAWVSESATVIGNVVLRSDVSIWPNSVLRGDNEPILIGPRSNVQECAVLHNDPGFPLNVGADVTIGHLAMLHGCSIGDGSLVGVQAVILNGAIIGKNCLVAAGAIVTERRTFADGSLIVGAPAKAVRLLSLEEIENLLLNADEYVEKAKKFRSLLRRV